MEALINMICDLKFTSWSEKNSVKISWWSDIPLKSYQRKTVLRGHEIHSRLVNISLKGLHEYYIMETQNFEFLKKKKKKKKSKWNFDLCWNPLSFVNISPTLVIDESMERSLQVLQHGSPKISISFQKRSKSNFNLYFFTLLKSWNHLSFVNISPTLVINTSMKSFSQVLQNGNQKILISFQKSFEI